MLSLPKVTTDLPFVYHCCCQKRSIRKAKSSPFPPTTYLGSCLQPPVSGCECGLPRAQSPEVDPDRAGQPCLLPIPTLGCWKHIYALVLGEQAEAREEVSKQPGQRLPSPRQRCADEAAFQAGRATSWCLKGLAGDPDVWRPQPPNLGD